VIAICAANTNTTFVGKERKE